MQNYGNILGVGQSAAAGQASAGQNYANNVGGLQQQLAAIRSQGAGQSSFGSAIGGATSGALSGAALGSIVPGVGTGIGAAVGGGLGLLGSLF